MNSSMNDGCQNLISTRIDAGIKNINEGWRIVFDEIDVHIAAMCVANDTLPLSPNLVSEARTSVKLQTGDLARSFQERVLEVIRRLLYLADKVVPECLKEEPKHTTFVLEEWVGYDCSQSWDRQMDAFHEAGGYVGLAESVLYVEWMEDILSTQRRWKIILQTLKRYLESESTFPEKVVLADEPPLTRRTRTRELERRLKLRGLELRPDSKICEKYIRYGGDLDNTVDVTNEMHFLFTSTDYRARINALHRLFHNSSKQPPFSLEKRREESKLQATDNFMKINPDRLDLVPSTLFHRLNKSKRMVVTHK